MRTTAKAPLCVLLSAVLGAAALLPPSAPPARAQDDPATVAPLNRVPYMNVFRRFEASRADAMFAFYGEVLGLERLGAFEDVGAGGVHRFDAGDGELKLTARVADRSYVGGAVGDGTGLRYVTLFYPDAAALAARFTAAGLPAPAFEAAAGSDMSAAFVQDPDGQWVKLVVAPGRDEAFYDQISVGLSVSDLDASRAFYRDFVGLEEQAAVEDALLGATVYPYRHGSTTVALFSFGADLPADTGSGGIQYIVSDAAAVDRMAQARGVAVETPLDTVPGYALTTIWLNDPDGITNYFAQTGRGPEPAANPPSD